jgi:SAM-dependent methyltransferase
MVAHCARLLRRHLPGGEPAGVIMGCGSGNEVVYLRQALETRHVVGVDVEASFSARAAAEECVVQADATRLPLASAAFDFAASFHSLEHIHDPGAALDEVQRVLRAGGWFYVGVPNRSRLVGYLGSFDATTWQKLAWNVKDWRARLGGQFRNERGAHAGFDREEFLRLLQHHFDKVQLLTEEFIRFKYARRLPRVALDFLLLPRLINYSAPSHYALCRKAS